MTTLNQVYLIGNVAASPENFTTKKGKKLINFPLAVNRKWPDETSEKVREVDYHKIIAWGNLAEICEKIIHKGDKILIQGSIMNHSYIDKNGETKYVSEIHATEINVLHWKISPKNSKKKELAIMSKKIEKMNKKKLIKS